LRPRTGAWPPLNLEQKIADNPFVNRKFLMVLLCPLALGATADEPDIGLVPLREVDPGLTGSGIPVALPEAGSPFWQVGPAAVGQPASLFRWIASGGTATNFPNALGQESGHANTVGGLCFGGGSGVAPGVSQVDNFEAGFFYNFRIKLQLHLCVVKKICHRTISEVHYVISISS